MYKLIIEDDEGKTTVVPLIRDEITIGRKEGNTIRLTERNVSRKHARLLKQNGHIFIEDVSSYNGIKLNGDKIEGRASVGEGDRIQIGDYQLALKMERQAGMPNGNGQADGRAPTPAAPMAVIAADEKTLPYLKESASGVPTAMIEAPTIQSSMVPARNESQGLARLVVTSSNFAGQEFLLDKAAVVIGRTDENDVVINHRSISRHHAKVVRENGHYHVVDLQSANGVRVNGEEYGKVELRRGDHIDLGHVRLRFVAPGEDFLFERDAQVVDVSGGKGGRTGVYLVIALCLLAGGGFAAWKLSGAGGGTNPAVQKQVSTDVDGQVSRLLLDADRALKNEEWDLAIGKCDEALRLDAGQEIARDKKQRAEAERKNHSAYLRFQQAAEKTDLDGAVAAFGEISEDSIYHQRGTESYARVKKGFIRLHLDEAKKQKAASNCDAARQHVSAVLTVDESNAEASTIMQNCGTPVKVQPPVEPKVHVAQPKPVVPKPDKPAKPDGATKPDPVAHQDQTDSDTPSVNVASEKALSDAQDAYVHGQYQTAIELARKAMKFQPAKSARIIGACSCFLKDRAAAVTAYQKCDTTGRSFLKYVCARANITVP